MTDKVLNEDATAIVLQIKQLDDKTLALLRSPKLPAILSICMQHPKFSPAPCNVFRAFALCPIDAVRVVILGQDPYPERKNADGLAFSCPTIQKSLENIFKNLIKNGLLARMPESGDLSRIAEQGVLLLNTALTIGAATSKKAHLDAWRESETAAATSYISDIIRGIAAAKPGIIWLLFGNEAAKHKYDIEYSRLEHTILTWSHPSPIFTANSNPADPRAFINCPHFANIQKMLAPPIDWNILLEEQVVKPLTDKGVSHFVFTDGASRKNGAPDCASSYAFIVLNASGDVLHKHASRVEGALQSNNRGELSGILRSLEYLRDNKQLDFAANNILIISDSQYSINCITKWFPAWSDAEKASKANIDLLTATCEIIRNSRAKISFRHMNSHTTAPARESKEYFYWKNNYNVDVLCTEVLK